MEQNLIREGLRLLEASPWVQLSLRERGPQGAADYNKPRGPSGSCPTSTEIRRVLDGVAGNRGSR